MYPGTNFPAECIEDIFHHLRGSDLLECTLVSPEWNEFIGSTRSCMQKIFITALADGHVAMDDLKKYILESKRKYECLKVQKNYSSEVQELFSLNDKKWTHIVCKPTAAEESNLRYPEYYSYQPDIKPNELQFP